MSIASVATRGYGTWSTVNQLPTWGYGIGAAVAVSVNDGSTAQSRSRVLISESRNRVWIAKGKSQ